MKWLDKLIFILGMAIAVSAQPFENFDADISGFPDGAITSVTIVNNIIWITSENGIAAYDGNTWQPYSINDELRSNFILSSMFKPAQEELWIGSDAGIDIFSVNGPSITSDLGFFSTANSGIISDNILSLNQDLKNNSWAGTDAGISVIQEDTLFNIKSGEPGINLYNNYINSLALSRDTVVHKGYQQYVPSAGVMYAATNGGGVGRFYYHEVDGISSASVVEKDWSGLPSDTVLAVFVDSKNNHWYGTPEGAASHYGHNSKYANWIKYKIQDGLANNRVTSVTSDNAGNIWFGTTGGISRFDGENWISFTEANGLISNTVNDVKADSQNNIWIATDKGLSKLSDVTSVSAGAFVKSDLSHLTMVAYPNPFNLEVSLKITLAKNSNVRIRIFSPNGEQIISFPVTYYIKGEHQISWNGRGENYHTVSSGIYFVQAATDTYTITRKIILLK